MSVPPVPKYRDNIIRELRDRGFSYRQIQQQVNVGLATINRVLVGHVSPWERRPAPVVELPSTDDDGYPNPPTPTANEPTKPTNKERPPATRTIVHVKGGINFLEHDGNLIRPLTLEEAKGKCEGKSVVCIPAGIAKELANTDWHCELIAEGFETVILKRQVFFNSHGDVYLTD